MRKSAVVLLVAAVFVSMVSAAFAAEPTAKNAEESFLFFFDSASIKNGAVTVKILVKDKGIALSTATKISMRIGAQDKLYTSNVHTDIGCNDAFYVLYDIPEEDYRDIIGRSVKLKFITYQITGMKMYFKKTTPAK